MSKVPEDFIVAHMKICSRKSRKASPIGEDSKYYGRRKFRVKNERSRQRECAKNLYTQCLKLGIEPTPIRADFVKQYDQIKGLA